MSVLKKRSQFLAVAAHGKKWVTPGFILQIAPAPAAASSVICYGLTASRKVGNAVARNRCRRRMRALFHEILPLHASASYAYVIVARGATVAHDYAALKKDLRWALKRMGALRE